MESSKWDALIDQLAEREWVAIDLFFPEEMILSFKKFFEEHQQSLTPAKIGSSQQEHRNTEIRTDWTYWLESERDISLRAFFEQIEILKHFLARELFLSVHDFECHLAEYPPGAFYKIHKDQFDGSGNRMISFILYLNEDWHKEDGGQLRIYQNHETIDIDPVMNRVVVFRSDTILHEVLPAKRTRRSVTGWFMKKPSGLTGI